MALRFAQCCDKAYCGALQVAALCSGKTEVRIQTMYEQWCNSGGPNVFSDQDTPEEEMWEQADEDGKDDPNEAHALLAQMQTETPFVDPDGEADLPEVPAASRDMAFEKVSDKEVLEGLFASPDAAECEGPGEPNQQEPPGFLPKTLLHAMGASGDRFNALFRLCIRLRSAPGGIDTRWIPNALKARKTTKKLNWFQCLGIQNQSHT